jgi:hemoglobin
MAMTGETISTASRMNVPGVFIQIESERGSTLYDRVGGEPFFVSLVERFYAGVEGDALLRPLYPSDLQRPKRRLALFLMQYWGGPHTYNAERGQPRLRMRHLRFRIGSAEREAWLTHMRAAVGTSDASQADMRLLLEYFESAATSLMNQPA